jgi:hypothetical protein
VLVSAEVGCKILELVLRPRGQRDTPPGLDRLAGSLCADAA